MSYLTKYSTFRIWYLHFMLNLLFNLIISWQFTCHSNGHLLPAVLQPIYFFVCQFLFHNIILNTVQYTYTKQTATNIKQILTVFPKFFRMV